MTVTLEQPITDDWRFAVQRRMDDLNLKPRQLAVLIGSSQSAVNYVLTRTKVSSLVPRIDAALAQAARQPTESHGPEEIAEIAVLRESIDAVTADIVRLETVRATVEERLAEAYEYRARLEIRLRERRRGS
jgi:antitoxin component HigA of HigAB toxin-antitoxin module